MNAVDLIRDRTFDLVINIPKDYQQQELTNDYMIRRAAVDFGVPLMTNMQLAQRLAEALDHPRSGMVCWHEGRTQNPLKGKALLDRLADIGWIRQLYRTFRQRIGYLQTLSKTGGVW